LLYCAQEWKIEDIIKKQIVKNSASIPKDKRIPREVKNSLSDLVPSNIWDIQQLSNLDTLYTNNRYNPITIQRIVLNYLYQEHGLIQSLIDQPVSDALRGGLEIISGELDGDDIKSVQDYLEQRNVYAIFKEVISWARLFGGSGLIINMHDDPTKELKLSDIQQDADIEFYAADRWELSSGNRISEFYNFYNIKIHNTRVLTINGKQAPSIIRPQLNGWGMSEVEHVVRELNAYLKHNNVVFELLDEAKIDIWKLVDFNSTLMTSGGTELIRKRIEIVNQQKNYQNAVLLDKEDDFEQKTMTFAGLSEMLREIRIGIATALRMPMTKLFGLSASGFNSGEDDLENYNAMIESEIRDRIRFPLRQLLNIIMQVKFGYIPDYHFQFKPLRVMDDVQEEQVNTSFQNRMIQLHQSQLMTAPEAIESLQTRKLIPIEVEAASLEDFPAQVRQDEVFDKQSEEGPAEGGANEPKSGNDKNSGSGKDKSPAQGKEKNKENNIVLPDQLAKGIKVEMEHTDDPSIAEKIARDHLAEHPRYYDYLEDMEKQMDKEKSL
jgi:phage-related protein (TIGR01555 family)